MRVVVSSTQQKSPEIQAPETTNRLCVRLCLNLHPCSHIVAINFRKLIWVPVSERAES